MAKKGDLKTAKSTAISLLANFKDSLSANKIYNFVGDLCMQHKHYCMQGNSLEQRYVYLFAYDMYEKAGNHSGMQGAKKNFPSLADSFTCAPNPPTGALVTVNCWINDKTMLRFRD